MCGISGIAYTSRERTPDRAILEAMGEALRHRGPDAEALLVEPGIGFAHRRLSIIDIPGGAQPMTDSDGIATIVFNGEVYNFRELRAELEALGRRFRTQSDTETLLLGYMEWGVDVLPRIAGMFAAAIWDRRSEELYLLRDRLGVKPLYWTELPGGNGIAFASELTALRKCPEVSGELNRAAIGNFAALSYVPGEESAIVGVQRLAPGHFLHWKRGASPSLRQYWNLASIWTSRTEESADASAKRESEFLDRLDQATRRRLVADVPLGGLLSGGIDSSAICALAKKAKGNLVTFSAGFDERTFDELPYARAMAAHLGTEHHDEIVSCESPDLLLAIAQGLDEPFADTSILPTYVLCGSARQRLTVALSGDGGDELLAGYTTHGADVLRRYLRWLPHPVLRAAERIAALVPEGRTKVGNVFKIRQFLRGVRLDAARAHASWRMLAMPDGLRRLIHPDFWSDATDPFAPALKAHNEVPELAPLDRQLYVDYKTWLVDDILTKADRASMAHGLEVRSPFLDHNLIEYCAGLPPELKFRHLRGKVILRKAARNLVPKRIITRAKRGFNAPVSHWLAGPWRELVGDTFDEHALRADGILNAGAVRSLMNDHLSERRDHGFLLFTLLMLCLWKRHHLP